MRYVPLVLLVIVPIVIWPTIWTVLIVLGLALPAAVRLIPEEAPSELDPALWHSDPAVRAERYATALSAWKRQHSPWRP
jgi:hypothetical protein